MIVSIKRWGMALAAAGLLVAGSPSAAQAYVRSRVDTSIPVQWKNQCIAMVVYNSNPPASLTPEAMLKATSAAASAWGRPGFTCTMLNLTTSATAATDAPVGNDGVNRVTFRQDKWCRHPADPKIPCYDPSMLALTTMTALADGTIIDADIEVNGVDFKWADRTVAGTQGQDLQTVLVHEFGHLIGLEHTCGVKGMYISDDKGLPVPACTLASSEQRAAIMFPSSPNGSPIRRILSADDAKAVCQIYAIKNTAPACRIDAGVPDASMDAPTVAGGSESGGCSFAGAGPSSPSVLGLSAGLALLLARRRRR